MLKINTLADSPALLRLALVGNLQQDELPALRALLATAAGRRIVLELRDLVLVDRAAMRFLCESRACGVEFHGCPNYVDAWIRQETTPG